MEESPDELLFGDLARKTTKVCFVKCVNAETKGLSATQKTCIKDCVTRYLQCRNTALEALKELAKRTN